MVSKESVLDRRYGAVIYAMLHSVQVAIVGLIITVGSIQIEFSMQFMVVQKSSQLGMWHGTPA
jgi:hypothetical protein